MHEQRHIAKGKITPPRIGVPLLSRPRLRQLIEAGARQRLIVLSAEAGYGKTALLLSVLPSLDLPVAWVTLDPGDADLNLFAATTAAAVAHVSHGTTAVDRLLVAGPNQVEVRGLLVRMLDDGPPLVLVLDDFHTVEENVEIRALVDGLLAAVSPDVHLIIAGRTWPRLSAMARLLAQGDAVILDKDALRFTPDEAGSVLRGYEDLAISAEAAEALAHRTEGWPAAIHLAALAARARGHHTLSGTPKEIFDYLASAVLDALPGDLHEFLLRTSVLSEFTPARCQALAPEVNPDSMLAEVERRNLFLYRLDDVGPRYRYHPLFADVLQQRLARQRGVGAVASLHLAAARRYEAEGISERAVRHYFAAGALADAERVMKPLHGDRLTATLAYTFRDLVLGLPGEILDAHPWMTRCGASAARFVGDYRSGLDLARRALAASENRDPHLWTYSIHGVGAMLGHMDRHAEVAQLCEQALEQLDAGIEARFRRGVIADLMDAYLNLGRVADAARLLPEYEALALEGTQPGKAYGILFYRGAIASARMEHTRAPELFRAFVQGGEERGSLTWQLWGWLEVLRAEIGRRQLPEARAAMARARQLQEEARERDSELVLSNLRGDVHLLAAEHDQAAEAYEHTLAIVRDAESQKPWIMAQVGLSRLARVRGNMAEATARLRQARAACERARLGGLLPQLQLMQISLLHLAGEGRTARPIVDSLRETFRSWDSATGTVIVAWWELALGLTDTTESALGAALSRAAPVHDDVLPFLTEEVWWTAPLLVRAVASGIEAETAASLLVQMGEAAVDPLVAALDSSPARLHAVRLLGMIGDARARRPLRAAARHRAIRADVDEALARLREPEPVLLDVRMLGRFEVRRNGREIDDTDWKTQKVKTLLKYLLLHRHRVVLRDELLEVLWLDVDPVTAAGRFKTTVKTLRQALEPLLEGRHSTFVVRRGESLGFVTADRCRVDLDELDGLVAAARAHDEAGRLTEAVTALERAAALYRGDLLEEDRYEDWAAAERERRREEHIGSLESLAALYARRHDHRRAVEALQKVLALDRLREPAYRALMTHALARGDRDAALRAFQTCDRLLREELGVGPQAETVALYQAALTGSPV